MVFRFYDKLKGISWKFDCLKLSSDTLNDCVYNEFLSFLLMRMNPDDFSLTHRYKRHVPRLNEGEMDNRQSAYSSSATSAIFQRPLFAGSVHFVAFVRHHPLYARLKD